jgi:hypothetical protein
VSLGVQFSLKVGFEYSLIWLVLWFIPQGRAPAE